MTKSITNAAPYRKYLGSLSSLYGLQLATLVLPLVLLPFLTRRLGAEAWGVLAVQTSLGTLLILVVEFGFGFGATRDAAAVRGDRKKLSHILSNVIAARFLLSAVVTVIWVAVWLAVPIVRDQAAAYWWTLGLTLAQGSSPAWFFQAVARLPFVMTTEFLARLASTVLILVFVHNSSGAWLVPTLQFATLAIALFITIGNAFTGLGFSNPKPKDVWALLRQNFHLCMTRLVQLAAPMGNTFLLGVISPFSAPVYGAAERTSVATRGLLSPILQIAFPEIVVLYSESPSKARHAVRRILFFLFVGAIIMSAVLWLLANLVVLILFGPEFAASVGVFRILLCSVPLFALIQVVGLQWLIPMKHDRAYLTSAVGGVAVNILAALLLVPHFGAEGMAMSLVASEFTVSIGLLMYTEVFGPVSLRILRSRRV